MPTPPYAKILIRVNGGAWQSGGISAAPGDVIDQKGESVVGWKAGCRFELYPPPGVSGISTPAGWTWDSNKGCFYYLPSNTLGLSPPAVTIPATGPGSFGTWMPVLTVNGGWSAPLLDTSSAISVASGTGMVLLGYLEERQYSGFYAWVARLNANLAIMDAAIAGGVGGGVSLGAAVPQIVNASTGAVGVATVASPIDHRHQVAVASPVAIGTALSDGASTSLARADHVHTLPWTTVVSVFGGATSALGMNGQKITALGTPTANTDAVTKLYADGVVNEASVRAALAAATDNVDFNGVRLVNIADPVDPSDAATKGYVDNAVSAAKNIKSPVRVVSTSDLLLAGPEMLDGVAVVDGDRVLVTGQSTPEENGIYVVDTGGSWTRATDADDDAEMTSGFLVPVLEGGSGPSLWAHTTLTAVTVGTTPLAFSKVGAPSGTTALPFYLAERDGDGAVRNSRSGVGVTQSDDVVGLVLDPSDAATAGNPQNSPTIVLRARAWDTDGSVEDTASWSMQASASDGTAVTGLLAWRWRLSVGAYTTRMSLTSAGLLTVSAGVVTPYVADPLTSAESGLVRGVAGGESLVTVRTLSTDTDMSALSANGDDEVVVGDANAVAVRVVTAGDGLVVDDGADESLRVTSAAARVKSPFLRVNTKEKDGIVSPPVGSYVGIAFGRGGDSLTYTAAPALVWEESASIAHLADINDAGDTLTTYRGLKLGYIESSAGTPAASGLVRGANTETLVAARNAGDTGDIAIAVGPDDGLYVGENVYTALVQASAKTGGWFAALVGAAEQFRVDESLSAFKYNAQGAATTLTKGVVVKNSTAAAAGAQQYSPPLMLEGRGWATGSSASQTVLWAIQTQPVEGATPTGELVFLSSINGSAAGPRLKLTSDGVVNMPNADTAPTTTEANSANLYVESGATKVRSENGVVTTVAPVGSGTGGTKKIDQVSAKLRTTDNTVTTAISYTMGDQSVASFSCQITARDESSGDCATFIVEFGAKKDTSSNVDILGDGSMAEAVTTRKWHSSPGADTWTATASASGANVLITVQGDETNPTVWFAKAAVVYYEE